MPTQREQGLGWVRRLGETREHRMCECLDVLGTIVRVLLDDVLHPYLDGVLAHRCLLVAGSDDHDAPPGVMLAETHHGTTDGDLLPHVTRTLHLVLTKKGVHHSIVGNGGEPEVVLVEVRGERRNLVRRVDAVVSGLLASEGWARYRAIRGEHHGDACLKEGDSAMVAVVVGGVHCEVCTIINFLKKFTVDFFLHY